MSTTRRLAEHPRLYITPEAIRLATRKPRLPLLVHANQALASAADAYVVSPEFEWRQNTHNAHLLRARTMQQRVLVLVVRYLQTRDRRYRDAAVAHIRAMGAWEYWSWITWRTGDARPEAIFDLSYGENSATLAIAYDVLHVDLSPEERADFLKIARERPLKSCLAHVGGPTPSAWWVGKTNSNWNTVCAGGAGMLCLAMYDELSECRRLLPKLEKSIEPFFTHLRETDGGWEEGLGYWNYGMQYGFMFLLSMEAATGRRHPLLRQPATRKTLSFPLDFSPRGCAAGFNDSNHWSPMPTHLAVAGRLGEQDVVSALGRALESCAPARQAWPELLLFHPGRRPSGGRHRRNVVGLYKGQDWGFLADRMPDPDLYCSVRGGTTKVPHGQRDLMSFNLHVKGEAMILNPQSGSYLDTTFSSRREELVDLGPGTKNVPFINGVGIMSGSTVKTRRVTLGRLEGIRIDGTEAMGQTRDGPASDFCGRLWVMLHGAAVLIVDRLVSRQVALFETRLHTEADVRSLCAGAELRGKSAVAKLAYGATCDAALAVCQPALTWPGKRVDLLRWYAKDLVKTVTFATLVAPGSPALSVCVQPRGRGLEVEARVAGRVTRVRLTDRLLPAR